MGTVHGIWIAATAFAKSSVGDAETSLLHPKISIGSQPPPPFSGGPFQKIKKLPAPTSLPAAHLNTFKLADSK